MPRFEFPRPLTLQRLEQILETHPAFTSPLVPVGDTTISISNEKHADRNMLLNNTSGVTATLPKASGTGDKFRFTVGALATANSHIIKVSSTSDVMVGAIWLGDSDTAGTTTAFTTNSTHDTITLNRSTTGSVTKGEYVELQDIANNTWQVIGFVTNTGNGATPFSSTVN